MPVATWNVNSVRARLPRLLRWLSSAEPDVVCLQELKCPAGDVPVAEFTALGYQVAIHSTGRWNGVALLSKVGLTDVRHGLLEEPGYQAAGTLLPVPEPRAVAATCAGGRIWSVYVPAAARSGTHISTTSCAGCARWPRPCTPSSPSGSTHVTPAERVALAAVRGEGLIDMSLESLLDRLAATLHR